ncbi:MAG: hypothetical protein HY606_05980 [Planctomycetes bacterium]|nr:hypothetical protein [Planctomycetota bacterium]
MLETLPAAKIARLAKISIILLLASFVSLGTNCKRGSSSSDDIPESIKKAPTETEKKGKSESGNKPNNQNNNPGGENIPKVTTTFFLGTCHFTGGSTRENDSPELHLSINGKEFINVLEDGHFPENVDMKVDSNIGQADADFVIWIAYNKGDDDTTRLTSEIYTQKIIIDKSFNVKSKQEYKITANSAMDLNPNLIADSSGKITHVVWFSEREDGVAKLFVKKADGTDSETDVSPTPGTSHWDPEVSSDGKLIVWVLNIKAYSGCASTIQVGELVRDGDKITGIKNVKTVSGTSNIVRTDPSFDPAGTKILYDIWDRDVSIYTEECWSKQGLKDTYQKYWKIERVNVDGTNREVIYSAGDEPALFLPIWMNDKEFLFSGMFFKEPEKTGEYSHPYKVDLETKKAVKYMEGKTKNCIWFDYLEVIR